MPNPSRTGGFPENRNANPARPVPTSENFDHFPRKRHHVHIFALPAVGAARSFPGSRLRDLARPAISGRTGRGPIRPAFRPAAGWKRRPDRSPGIPESGFSRPLHHRSLDSSDGLGPDPEGGFARILDKSSYLLYLNRRGAEFMDRSVVLFLSLADGRGIGVGGPADAIALGVWTHVAVAYDGRSAVTMAIDGNPVPVFQPAGPPAGPVADASWSPLFIGDSPHRPRFFRGDIGPIRLWSSVRSPEAIAADRFRMDARGKPWRRHGPWPKARARS
jgi:hypothetical protein